MPRQPEHEYDVLIVGSSLGGLSAGAIMANRGYKVAIVDAQPNPGGRMGGTLQNGYWISWGQRDGLGSSDLAFIPHYIYEAAELAGVTLKFAPLVDRFFRLHWLPDRTTSEMPAELVVPNNNDPMTLMREMVRCFSKISKPDEVEPLAEELLFGKLVRGGAVKVTLKDDKLDFEIVESAIPALPSPDGGADRAPETVE